MFGGFFGGLAGGTFSGQYRCFPVSFIDKNEAETGNKIFLPSSALDRLGRHRYIKLDIGPSHSICRRSDSLPDISALFNTSDVPCSILAYRVPHAVQGRE